MSRKSVIFVIAALVGAAIAAGSAVADSSPVYYVALGDSLAIGSQPSAGQPSSSAGTKTLIAAQGTNRGYVDDLYKVERAKIPNLQLRNFGCGGETTQTMITGGVSFDLVCGYANSSQLDQAVAFLQAHPGQIAFVTIDIGANDFVRCLIALDFSNACLNTYLPRMTRNLSTILARLHGAAGESVSILGMNYYDPFLGLWVFGMPAVATDSEEFIVQLNDALEGGYQAAGDPVADVEGAFAVTDFADSATLQGYGTVPLNVYNACTLTWFCSVGDVHPNDAGYALIARAFEDLLP